MDNNVLIISEKDQKAYLPYKYEDVEKIYKTSNGKYNSIIEVIQDIYVVSLDNFKNFSFARFREAFNLMIFKEKRFCYSCFGFSFRIDVQIQFKPYYNYCL